MKTEKNNKKIKNTINHHLVKSIDLISRPNYDHLVKSIDLISRPNYDVYHEF